ncbi:TusE/DsrC/DsvC family sulfur relay protein [bacterium]|nr:TusE/DsrC/DsvC family sulfur relay protein [bacterium]
MQVDDRNIEFDSDGFMIEPALWDDAVASAIASEEGIDEMSEEHWRIVKFIREYWLENGLAPPVRMMCQEVGVGLRQIYKLFTAGPARGACRVAGLPKPDGCV